MRISSDIVRLQGRNELQQKTPYHSRNPISIVIFFVGREVVNVNCDHRGMTFGIQFVKKFTWQS